MSVLKSLGAESLFGDVQRMDKRQVRARKTIFTQPPLSHESEFSFRQFLFAVFLSSPEFRDDRLVRSYDLERPDGCDR